MHDNIQLATLADIDDIHVVERASTKRFTEIGMPDIANAEPIAVELLEKRINAEQVLVFRAPQIVGFISFYPLGNSTYIEQVDVHTDLQGRRVGARLIDAVGSWTQPRQSDSLLLSTFREVPWNAPYYRRLGFIDLEEATLPHSLLEIRRKHVARGLDETRRVFMSRPISGQQF